jgi:hypothetical protein
MTKALPTEATEHVSEHLEGITTPEASKRVAATSARSIVTIECSLALHIVSLPLLRVGQDLIGT